VNTSPYTSAETAAERRDGVSWSRVLWVAPLTVALALAVNLVIRTVLQALFPALMEMGQLGRSLIVLTLVGAILAVIVFVLTVWLVPHPIRWYRIIGVIALVISLVPDFLLGLGGDARRTGSAMVAPFSRLGALFFPAPQGGSPPGGRRWTVARGGATGAALGPGADSDAVAHGHRRGLHRAPDHAHPRSRGSHAR